jgi:uncharacterized membrane protein (UPF0182 family)
MRLPGEHEAEFIQILPLNFTRRENMAAWLAARSDGERYGQLIAYVFPRGTQTFGPRQVEATIQQDGAISQQLALWNRQGSSVLWGNLLVMPIENSLLYVVPLFLSAAQSSIPEMKRVILWHGGKVVMEPTLVEAIQALFQGADVAELPTAPAGVAEGGPPTPGTISGRARALAETAARQLEAAESAQRRGDWAGYGKALERLRTTLRDLRGATGGS